MSHFSVLVIGDDVEGLLAPYDEDISVTPYPVYEDEERGVRITPAEHWFARSFIERREAPPSHWAAFVEAYNAAFPDPDDAFLLSADGRPYRMSQYNPDSRWDYWVIGGRWRGSLLLRADATGSLGERDLGDKGPDPAGRCDQARKGDLDIAGMRRAAEEEAAAAVEQIATLTEGCPRPLPWSAFAERVSLEYPMPRAQEEWRAQPYVAKVLAAAHARGEYFVSDDALLEAEPRATYLERARLRAVPGFATLSEESGWIEKGRMGWFGSSTATADSELTYLRAANELIDAADEDTLLTIVDCHI